MDIGLGTNCGRIGWTGFGLAGKSASGVCWSRSTGAVGCDAAGSRGSGEGSTSPSIIIVVAPGSIANTVSLDFSAFWAELVVSFIKFNLSVQIRRFAPLHGAGRHFITPTVSRLLVGAMVKLHNLICNEHFNE
jgi:hypothetical protein